MTSKTKDDPQAGSPRQDSLSFLGVLKVTISAWFAGQAPSQSAALAFYTLFSMTPVLMIVMAITGAVFGAEATQAEFQRQAAEIFGSDAGKFVGQILEGVDRPGLTGWAGVSALVALFFGATAFFAQLQESLNAIWEVTPEGGNLVGGFLKKRLLSLGLVLIIGFLLLISLVISVGLAALGNFLENRYGAPPELLQVLNFGLFFLVTSVLFALIFRVLPDAKIEWRDVAVGAMVTSLLFSLGKTLIGLYLGKAGVASAYGAAGSLVVLLLWVYYGSMLLLLGAGFTRAWSRRHRTAPVEPEAGAKRRRNEEMAP